MLVLDGFDGQYRGCRLDGSETWPVLSNLGFLAAFPTADTTLLDPLYLPLIFYTGAGLGVAYALLVCHWLIMKTEGELQAKMVCLPKPL